MGLGKKPGIVRRPIEYVLVAIIMLLIGVLLWSIWEVRKDNETLRADDKQEVESFEGTLSEVDDLTEADLKAEKALDGRYDTDELNAASADSAADNIGGVYDETTY